MCESRRDDKARRVRRAFAQLTGAIFDRDRTLEGKHALSITKQPTSNAKLAAGHCHEGRDLIDYAKSRSGGMADAADLKSAAW